MKSLARKLFVRVAATRIFVLLFGSGLVSACHQPSVEPLVAASSVSALTAAEQSTPYVFHVEAFRQGDESWSDAFERMMDDPRCAPTQAGTQNRQGCRVELACGTTYQLTRPLDVCRRMVLEGCGGGGPEASTKLAFPRAVRGTSGDGVRLHFLGQCPRGPQHGGAEQTVIRDLAIVASGSSTIADRGYGVLMRAASKLENVWIDGFADGIRIEAAAPTGQASGFGLVDPYITNVRRHAIWISGADANAGYTIGVKARASCIEAPAADCAAIVDASFLGNLHLAPMTHAARSYKGPFNGTRFPGYVARSLSAGSNARTLFVNPYAEHDQLTSRLDTGTAMTIWGLSNWAGIGSVIQPSVNGIRIPGLVEVQNPTDPANVSTARVGRTNMSGSVIEWASTADNPGVPWRLNFDMANGPTNRLWTLGFQNVFRPLALSGFSPPAGMEKGALWLTAPWYAGPSASRVRVGYGPTPPTPDDKWPPGSEWINTTPAVGSVDRWRLVAISNVKTWRPVGRVE